jgi:exonuclease-1
VKNVRADQNGTASKADAPLDLDTFAYTPMTPVCHPDRPDISAFAYRPVKNVHADRDQDGTASKADAPLDLGTFAYTPLTPVCHPDRSKLTGTAMKIAGSPPDLSTFAYKPMKGAVRYSDGSRFGGTALSAAGGTSRRQFK